MGVSHRLMHDLPADRIDVRLAGLGIVLALLLLPFRLFASDVLIETLPLVLAAGCLVYLGGVRRSSESSWSLPAIPESVLALAPAGVMVGLAGLLVMLRVTGSRTLAFHALAALLGTVVLLQVFFAEDRALAPGVVLVQILGLALVVRFSALYSVAGYIGVDVWIHVPVWTAGIVRSGSLEPLSGIYYLTAPIYHAFLAFATQLLGVGLRNALFLTLGTVLALSAGLVYGIARYFVTARWALVAALMVAVGDQFVRWSIHLIPESLGLLFFLGVLYGLTRMHRTGHEARSVGLTLAFGLGVVFTHQLSTFITLTLLGVAAIAQLAGRRWGVTDRLTVVGVFAGVLAVTLVTWMNTPYGGTSFLVRMTEGITRNIITEVGFLSAPGTGGSGPAGGSAGLLDLAVPYVEVLGLLLLLFGTVIGSLALVDESASPVVTATYLGAIAVMLAVVFGLPVFNVRDFLPGRWLAFLYGPMVVVSVVGFQRLSRAPNARLATAVLIIFAVTFPGAMVVAEKATLERPVFDDRQARFSYTEAELGAVGSVGDLLGADAGAVSYTDHPYRTLFVRLEGLETRIVQVDDQGEVVSAGPVIYRTYQSEGGAVIRTLDDPPDRGTHLAVPAAGLCPAGRNTVYANDDVRLCLPTEVA